MKTVMMPLVTMALVFGSLWPLDLIAQNQEPAKLPEGWTRLEPLRSDLGAVDFPDLNNAEEVVRNQIMRFRNSLITLARNYPDANQELSNAYGLLGSVCFAYKMRYTAEQCFNNAVKLNPGEFRWSYILGILNSDQGDAEEAITFLEQAAKSKGDYGPLWTHLGDLHMRFNRIDEARKNYQKSLEINPQSTAAMFGMGEVAMYEEKPEEAVEWFEKVLTLVPQANRVHYSLGQAWRKAGDKQKARHHLSLAGKVGVREADPLMEDLQRYLRGERVHMIRGKTAFGAGRFQDAVVEYQKAVKSKPDSLRARVNLGTSLGMMGRNEEAMVQFREVLKLDPENLNAHYNLGQILSGMGQWKEAGEHLAEVVAASPADMGARLALVKALARLQQFDTAMQHMQRIADEGPLNEAGVLALYELNYLSNKEKEARDTLLEGFDRMPDSGLIAHSLARFLASCKDLSLRDGKKAVELATKVMQVSSSPDHAITLAMAYAENGDCKAAADIQAQVVAALSEQNTPENIALMQKYLEHYQNNNPCRL